MGVPFQIVGLVRWFCAGSENVNVIGHRCKEERHARNGKPFENAYEDSELWSGRLTARNIRALLSWRKAALLLGKIPWFILLGSNAGLVAFDQLAMPGLPRVRWFGLSFLIQLIGEVAADVAAFWMAGEPGGEFVHFGEVFGADAVAESVREGLGVNGGTNLALVAGGTDQMKGDVQSFAFESFPFAFFQPDATSCRAARDVERQAVADAITQQQAAGFRAEERFVFWLLRWRGRGFIGGRYRNFGLLFFPGQIGLEGNPQAAGLWAFVHHESGFKFLGLHGGVRVKGTVHDLIHELKKSWGQLLTVGPLLTMDERETRPAQQ